MSLGNNRDYKTNTDRVNRNMRIHKVIMTNAIEQGMDKDAADNFAYKSLTSRDDVYRAVCKGLGIPAKRPVKAKA